MGRDFYDSLVLRRHRYRAEKSKRVVYQVGEAEERASRDRQVVPPVELECGTGELQLGHSVPVLLMHKDKTGSVKTVSVRRVRLPPLWVGVVECAVSKELPDFLLE